jgi:hypothetical protein
MSGATLGSMHVSRETSSTFHGAPETDAVIERMRQAGTLPDDREEGRQLRTTATWLAELLEQAPRRGGAARMPIDDREDERKAERERATYERQLEEEERIEQEERRCAAALLALR